MILSSNGATAFRKVNEETTVKTESEVREELDRLFPAESNQARLDEWCDLVSQGLTIAATARIRKWQIEAEKSRRATLQESDKKPSALKYINLTDSSESSGITMRGSADIGRMISGSDVLKFKAMEFVDIDLKLATYTVQVTLSKNDNEYSSSVKYDEIGKLLNAIQSMRKVTFGVTEFETFQVDWSGQGGFSISVYSDDQGRINSAIRSSGADYFLNSVERFDKLEALFTKAKTYIDSHLQRVGRVDFILIDEIERNAADLLAQLPSLVVERISQYVEILSKKFLQLTYLDDYGIRDYGSFYSEIDRFNIKNIPELTENHREIARGIIFNLVENFITINGNSASGFNENMSPLDYEMYCANAFSLAGWFTSMTPKIGDQGADVVIKHGDLSGVVQCKLYSQPVGNAAVQEVIAAREYYKTSFAIVVSNATYTTSARQLAAMANVVLLHHGEIADHSSRLGVAQFAQRMRASSI